MTASSTSAVGVRTAVASDERVLRTLFVDSRPELAALPPQVAQRLLDLQWRAQAQQYATDHPHARRLIVETDGVAVGHLVVDESGADVRVVDLTVATGHRGRGIARQVLTQLLASGRGVGLTVWSANLPARRLYESLGFEYLTTDEDGYLPMRHTPNEALR